MSRLLQSKARGTVHYAWIVALACALAMVCGLGLGRFAFGMMLPSMSESLQLSYAQGGLLGFSNMVGYMIAVLLVPFVLPKLRTRGLTTVSLLLICSSMLGLAFSNDFVVLCLLYCVTGIGSGGVVLPTMSVMSHWFKASHRGLASGIVMAGPGVGIIASGYIVPRLESFHSLQSWQSGWLLFSLICAVVALLAYAIIRNHPSDVGAAAYGRVPTGDSGAEVTVEKSKKVRLLASMGLIFAIYGATYMLYVTFIVTSMVDSYHLSEAVAGNLWACFGFLSVFSGVLFGGLSDRIGRRAGMAVAFVVLAVAYGLVGFVAWIPGLYISVALFGLAAWSIPVIMSASAGDYFGSASAANALAALTLAFSFGQGGGPVVAGYIAEATGDFADSYAASALAALLAVGLVALLRPPSKA